ncbi:hypothetical protein DFH09DRAFT_1094510 [Mycena vulgaris]|nr:hypothetical protein DFH09DRAFT_1094510 [Mycena vulgaris]
MPSNEKYQSAYGNSARHIYCTSYGRLVTSLVRRGVYCCWRAQNPREPAGKPGPLTQWSSTWWLCKDHKQAHTPRLFSNLHQALTNDEETSIQLSQRPRGCSTAASPPLALRVALHSAHAHPLPKKPWLFGLRPKPENHYTPHLLLGARKARRLWRPGGIDLCFLVKFCPTACAGAGGSPRNWPWNCGGQIVPGEQVDATNMHGYREEI